MPLCAVHQEIVRSEVWCIPRRALSRIAQLAPDRDARVSVVYYLGDPASQLIKIGMTTGLKHRMKCLLSEWPGLKLLATEPGGYPEERARHAYFGQQRVVIGSSREWFRKGDELMELIARLRQLHGLTYPGPDVPEWWVAPLRRAA